ncbi:hypothetical protein QFC22_000539 [Naganishia vaughanmartiniae]|uniref:Uncharacterized protein n=1 Tax=Naganishia vaughanmartiniae TaxID=1424756 RepID=A0ACC2XQN6_9TREE|nr:hypothetical protein QFC22_000539 [Naganishia vaughanmartiniae]
MASPSVPTPPQTTTAIRTNPISLRLWKIISHTSTSSSTGNSGGGGAFDDPASREALDIVSERYCGKIGSTSFSTRNGKGTGKGLSRDRKRNGRGGGVGYWLGAEAVSPPTTATAGGHSNSEEEDDSEEEVDSSSAEETTPAIGTPARPGGVLSRNQSSMGSIRSTTTTLGPGSTTAVNDINGSVQGEHGAAGASSVNGATNARKYFKSDLEKGLIEGSLKFLSAFEKVDEQLQLLRAHMHEMQDRCSTIQADVDRANTGTEGLLRRANGLREQEQSAAIRNEISQLFLSRFTLTPAEIHLLKSRSLASSSEQAHSQSQGMGVDMQLFEVMDKVKRIRADCRALFEFVGADGAAALPQRGATDSPGGDGAAAAEKGEEGEGKGIDGEGVEGRDISLVAKEVMATTTEHLEDAYEKLHRWAMFEFRKVARGEQVEVSPVMREAVKRLRERRDLLDDVLNLLTTTRQQYLLQQFLEALTRGGPNGLPRPIELHAHDPTRYVGDMLAWVHQATASEREFLDALFDVRGYARRMVGEARDMSGEAEEEEALARRCLDRTLEGLSRPLKVRIQHTVKSQEGIIVTYKIANLVQFYLVTMQRTIGDQALLTKALQEIFDSAHEAFLETLASQGRSLLRFLHPPEPDLAPPMALHDSSATLHEIMSVYDTSLVDEGDREADFAQILQAAVDPLVKMCQHMVDIWPKGTEWEKNIFMINCSLYLQHVLEPYAFTSQRVAELQEQIDSRITALKQEHYRLLSEQSGLNLIVAAMDGREDPETPLSRLAGAEPKAISQAMKSFESFLASLDIMTSSSLARLTSARIASDIHRFALDKIAKDYERTYSAVLKKDNKYEFPSTLLSRDPQDVYMLMGLD